MTNKQKIQNIANAIGGKLYEDYSGRGMFGKTCLGITCSNFMEAIEEAGSVGIRGASYDNLGRDWIVYWPRLTSEEE